MASACPHQPPRTSGPASGQMRLMQNDGKHSKRKQSHPGRAEAVEFHVPRHFELRCMSLCCFALLCASLCPMIFQPQAWRNATNELMLFLYKCRHWKHVVENSYSCVFIHKVPPQDGPGSSSRGGLGSRQSRKVQSSFPASSCHLPSIGPAHKKLPHGISAESSLSLCKPCSQRWV